MRARRVEDLEGTMPLAVAARRIVAVRVDELFGLADSALAGEDVVALHDMRIAAKRLRYVLELVGFCLGDVAREAERRMRELQTVVGDIHDCDVLLERLVRRDDFGIRGMRALGARVSVRRRALFVDFVSCWSEIEATALHERIVAATSYSPNGAMSRA